MKRNGHNSLPDSLASAVQDDHTVGRPPLASLFARNGIDPRHEELIPLTQVPKRILWLPKGKSGKRLDCSTPIRWFTNGLLDPSGKRIHLRAIRIGGRLCTTERALIDFFDALTPTHSDLAPVTRTPDEIARDRARTHEILVKAGIRRAGTRPC